MTRLHNTHLFTSFSFTLHSPSLLLMYFRISNVPLCMQIGESEHTVMHERFNVTLA